MDLYIYLLICSAAALLSASILPVFLCEGVVVPSFTPPKYSETMQNSIAWKRKTLKIKYDKNILYLSILGNPTVIIFID